MGPYSECPMGTCETLESILEFPVFENFSKSLQRNIIPVKTKLTYISVWEIVKKKHVWLI